MHEMSIIMQIIRIVRKSVPGDMDPASVRKIHLRVSKRAGYIPEYMRYCFGMAVKGTSLGDASLDIEEIPIMASCRGCHHRWTIDEPVFMCENCGSDNIEVTRDSPMELISIELVI